MIDFEQMFSLMERIDRNYKNTLSLKREIKEARDGAFSYEELNRIYSFDDFDNAFDYCEKHLGFCIGKGSSRAVFQIDDAKCLKIALNKKGIQQNKVEAETNRSNCLLFPLIFNTSQENFWMETEYVLPATEEDFIHCLNMDWADFNAFIYNLHFQKYSKYKDPNLISQINDDKSGILRNLYDYVIKKRIPVGDMLRMCNWGMTVRNGKETLVLLDSGWNKETMRMYGGNASTSRSQYSSKISYDSDNQS